eukprot:m.123677 g.123677  ORF g.123677 m.123677 type:complete len:123 (+) comp14451_c0_seq6:360-728(+)
MEYAMYPRKLTKEHRRRRRELGLDMYKLLGIHKEDTTGRRNWERENLKFFGAPIGLIITIDRIFDKNGWGHVGMFLQTLCLAAEAEGLATCLEEMWGMWYENRLILCSKLMFVGGPSYSLSF